MDHFFPTISRSMRAALLIFSACLMCRNWFGEKTSQMCVLFSSFFNRTSESRKCVRHEIRPGYLLSHALASRLPSNRTKPPLREGLIHNAHTFIHIHVDPHARYTTYSWHTMQQTPTLSKFARLCVPILKHADTNEHQQVNMFTQSTLLNQSQRQKTYTSFHFAVCKQMWMWIKSQFYNLSCIIMLKKGRPGQISFMLLWDF